MAEQPKKIKRYAFDIETDNLLRKLKRFHCAGVINVETGEEFWFGPKEAQAFLDKLDEADIIIAHNALGFDVPALMKLFPHWKPKAKVTCTKVLSQVLNFNRFSADDKEYKRYLELRKNERKSGKLVLGISHGLARWGIFFNDYKGEFSDFSEYTEEMMTYMQQDVRLLVKVYKYLLAELESYIKETRNRSILSAISSENEMERIMTEETENGWLMDKDALDLLFKDLEQAIETTTKEINPKLLTYVRCSDESGKALDVIRATIKEAKKNKVSEETWPSVKYVEKLFKKNGEVVANVAKYFDLQEGCTINDSPVGGPFCRIEFIKGDINNTDQVKDYLYTIGWKPDEWNWKRDEFNKLQRISPKLTDSSLEALGEVGADITKFYTLRSRYSILKGWYEELDEGNRLHGDVFNIGTPTFRQTHNIIANLPSGNALYGPEIRRLFVASDGYVQVSADSAACQLRLLAHYMGDPKFTNEVIHGDVHALNASIIECERPQAKRFIFAYLYGAGPPKLSGYIGKTVEETKVAIERYKKKLPKLANLIKKVNSQVMSVGYVTGLDGRKLCLPPAEKHKALNYLIQGAEAVIMKATVVMIDEELRKNNIDFRHLLFYHDEHTVEVKLGQEEKAREIIMKCFEEAPKAYGIDIMTCGDCKIGHNYYDVH